MQFNRDQGCPRLEVDYLKYMGVVTMVYVMYDIVVNKKDLVYYY